jgi:hypothetical protein
MEYTVNLLRAYFAVPAQPLGKLVLELVSAVIVVFTRAELGD